MWVGHFVGCHGHEAIIIVSFECGGDYHFGYVLRVDGDMEVSLELMQLAEYMRFANVGKISYVRRIDLTL